MIIYDLPLSFEELTEVQSCVEKQKFWLERMLNEFPHLAELFVVERRRYDKILKKIKQTKEGAEWE